MVLVYNLGKELKMEATTHKEILSYPTKLLLVEMIKKFKQEDKKDEIIDVILAVANDIKTNDSITAKAIKDEVEEKLKNELATKDFVRAEINQVRTEIAEAKQELKVEIAEVRAEIAEAKSDIIKWMIGLQIALGGFIVALLKLF